MPPDAKDTQQWMVLYTKPRAEKKASENLEKQGFTVYLPCVTVVKQWSDRKKKIQEPLFKSYLFIYSTKAQAAIAGRNENIVGVVRFNGQAAMVREEEMEAIRRIEAGAGNVDVVATPLLPVGQKVRIKQGNLQGLTGTLTEHRGSCRVAIEIESLGCDLLVEVPGGNVEEIK